MFYHFSSNNKQIEASKTRYRLSTSCKRSFPPTETAGHLNRTGTDLYHPLRICFSLSEIISQTQIYVSPL